MDSVSYFSILIKIIICKNLKLEEDKRNYNYKTKTKYFYDYFHEISPIQSTLGRSIFFNQSKSSQGHDILFPSLFVRNWTGQFVCYI